MEVEVFLFLGLVYDGLTQRPHVVTVIFLGRGGRLLLPVQGMVSGLGRGLVKGLNVFFVLQLRTLMVRVLQIILCLLLIDHSWSSSFVGISHFQMRLLVSDSTHVMNRDLANKLFRCEACRSSLFDALR